MTTYQELDAKLQGRCRDSRKLANNTYAQRRERYGKSGIAILLHNTDILTFYPNGDIYVNTGGWHTVTTRSRMNDYLPRPWSVGGHRGRTLLYTNRPEYWTPVAVVDDALTIKTDVGTIEDGGDVKELMDRIRQEDLEAQRPRNRARYWINKAREGKPSKKLTVANILEEENQTVRLAKMRVYGLDRFILQSSAKIIDEHAGYELLELPLDRWSTLKALKMKCSTTGAVYINQVPPNRDTVPAALDWMFDTKDYLGQVTQQT